MVAVWKLHQYLAVTHVSIGWIMALHGPGSSCWARWQRYNGRDKSNVLRHCCLRCQWEFFFLQKAIIIAASFPRSVVDVVRWNVLIDPFECQFNYSISWGLTRWSAKKKQLQGSISRKILFIDFLLKSWKVQHHKFFSQHRTMNPDIPLDPTDDRASVGYNTVPKPLVTQPKVSVSTRPHILDSVMFSQILLIWKC